MRRVLGLVAALLACRRQQAAEQRHQNPNSGALASSNTRVHTGRPDKGGGEEKCHGCKKIAEEETDEGDVDGEDLHGEEEEEGGRGRNIFRNYDHPKRHEMQMAK